MSPWLWMILGVALSGAVTWYLLHRMTQEQRECHEETCESLKQILAAHNALTVRLADLHAELTAPEPEHPLTGVAFLPTDMEAAQMERMIAASEDRAIHAGGGTVPSSGPSRRLAARSLQGASTRRARTSGGAS